MSLKIFLSAINREPVEVYDSRINVHSKAISMIFLNIVSEVVQLEIEGLFLDHVYFNYLFIIYRLS
jgi:hypothetical protein